VGVPVCKKPEQSPKKFKIEALIPHQANAHSLPSSVNLESCFVPQLALPIMNV
jgi:hypothetical protein